MIKPIPGKQIKIINQNGYPYVIRGDFGILTKVEEDTGGYWFADFDRCGRDGNFNGEFCVGKLDNFILLHP